MKPVHPVLPEPTPALIQDLPAADSQSALCLVKLQAFVLRYPIKTPVRTSFGTMHDRPAVFVRAEDADGQVGWGEIWCNFPACGAEHRARLLDTVLAPLLLGQKFSGPAEVFAHCTRKTHILALQTGEPGPIAQVIAGIDLALWDLWARRAGLPLHRLLGSSGDRLPVYASGINPDAPQDIVAARRADGYRGFKLKIGFGQALDLGNIAQVRAILQPGDALMLDVNQAWDLRTAMSMLPLLQAHAISWLEEPLAADAPPEQWLQLQRHSVIGLAAGENMQGEAEFAAAAESGVFAVLQPDLAKWGGISGCWPVIQRIRAAGLRFCPHFLGAGIGLMASAHVLAAAGGEGMLEVDANPNPLRSELAPPLARIVEGEVALGELPGLGFEVDLDHVSGLCAAAQTIN